MQNAAAVRIIFLALGLAFPDFWSLAILTAQAFSAGEIERKPVWIAALSILFLTIILSLLFSRRFSQRVQRLEEFSRRLAAGDLRPSNWKISTMN